MTLASLVVRLDKVEPRVPRGCPTCRRWSRVAYAEADEPDGGRRPERPEVCPDCGRCVPIALLVTIVGVPLEAV
jgi:hypothetical protein